MKYGDATSRFYDEIWPHRATVLRTARYFSSNDADADDLAQETLVKAFSSLDSFAPGSNAKAWLMTILRHTHIDRTRSKHASDVSLDALEVDVAANASDAATDYDWHDATEALEAFADSEVIAALKGLPRDICWTLLLVDVEGLDDAEAAAVLKVPGGTVKSRLHRGRRMLRDVLQPVAKARRIGG